MQHISQQLLTGERALFKARELDISDTTFADGESPLKESAGIDLTRCVFAWKYPLWYSRDVRARDCSLLQTARSGIWYTHGIHMADCVIDAPKTFRRSSDIVLERVSLSHADETLWTCEDVTLRDVCARGDYFGMNSARVRAENLTLSGNYSFDGAHDVEVRASRLISKDAFWNCENVTVYDSTIIGEYLGWNSKNVRFVNCTIQSLQGLCYLQDVTLENCRLLNTTLAFEYCSGVDAQVTTRIDSVKNPYSGRIEAAGFGEVIFDDPAVDREATTLATKE